MIELADRIANLLVEVAAVGGAAAGTVVGATGSAGGAGGEAGGAGAIVGGLVAGTGEATPRNGPVISYVRPVDPSMPRCELT